MKPPLATVFATKSSSLIVSDRCVFGVLFLAIAYCLVPSSYSFAHDGQRPVNLREVSFDQKLNEQVPLDLRFRDESGNSVELSKYFNKRPVILNFVYSKCRDLCPLLLDGVARALKAVSFSAGNEFDVITVSFDPQDTPALAAAKKADVIQKYSRPGASSSWHFLTADQAAIDRLTQAVGFRYNYDPDTGEFGHATGIVLLTPEGKTSRYFYGIDFSPRDLRLGLVEAAANRIGSPIDQLLLFCFHYDPASGKYTMLVTNILRLAAGATVLAIGGFIFLMVRREGSSADGRGLSSAEYK